MRAAFPNRFAVILGTNEIASAVAVQLHRNNYRTVLSHDPQPPVMRRKMAFHDALYDDGVAVEGIAARRADSGLEIRASFADASRVTVTELGLLDLIVIQAVDILIDARMQKYLPTPDLRRLGRLTIGLGPGFATGLNCDVAIETRPAQAGRIIRDGCTDEPDGISQRLGDRAGERFVRADFAGRWNTAIEIGTRVFRDFVVGHLGRVPVRAPFDGFLRGIVRDGTEVLNGAKLLEIDSRGRQANWTETDERGRLIANAVAEAVATHEPKTSATMLHPLHLMK
jgi:xanthine dehydrogenase accessory factor